MSSAANHASAASCLPDLAPYLAQLDEQGYAVVPPEVTGVSASMIDELVQQLLDKSEELIGCKFSVEDGPGAPAGLRRFSRVPGAHLRRGTESVPVDAAMHLPSGVPRSGGESSGHRAHRPPVRRRWRCGAFQPGSLQLAQLLRQVGRRRLRRFPWPARRPSRHPAAVGRQRAQRQLQLVPHGLHPRGRSLRLCARLAPAQVPTDAAGVRCRSDCGGVPARLAHRFPRRSVARRISEEDARPAVDHRQLLPPHGDLAARRHPQPLSRELADDCVDPGLFKRLAGSAARIGRRCIRCRGPVSDSACTLAQHDPLGSDSALALSERAEHSWVAASPHTGVKRHRKLPLVTRNCLCLPRTDTLRRQGSCTRA